MWHDDKREQIQAGEGWGILAIVLLLLIACASVAADIYLNMHPQ